MSEPRSHDTSQGTNLSTNPETFNIFCDENICEIIGNSVNANL
jgi:hypothetical protein